MEQRIKVKDRGEPLRKKDQGLYDLYREDSLEDISFHRKKYLPIAIDVNLIALFSLLYHK